MHDSDKMKTKKTLLLYIYLIPFLSILHIKLLRGGIMNNGRSDDANYWSVSRICLIRPSDRAVGLIVIKRLARTASQ
jgi:hypothetical protein